MNHRNFVDRTQQKLGILKGTAPSKNPGPQELCEETFTEIQHSGKRAMIPKKCLFDGTLPRSQGLAEAVELVELPADDGGGYQNFHRCSIWYVAAV